VFHYLGWLHGQIDHFTASLDRSSDEVGVTIWTFIHSMHNTLGRS
jgi:hypothetical protein